MPGLQGGIRILRGRALFGYEVGSKRRTWRKLHLAIDAESHEIQAVAVTEAGVDDAEEVDHLLKPIDREVARAAADRAYDKRKVYRVLEPRTGRGA